MSSTDAVVEMLLQLLHQAYHGNKEERTDATARLESIFTSAEAPQHLLALLLAGTTSTLAPAQSLSALLYAKNCFTHTTPDSILQSSPTIVLAMEETIFDGIFTVPATHRRVLIAISATLMSGFEWSYVDRLLPMMEASSQNIAQTPADYAIAALELLYVYAKRYKTVHLEPMEVKLEVCGELVAMLPRYLAYDDFRVSRMVLKLMECVSETALQQTSAKTIPGNALDAWTALWVAFPEQHHARAVAAGGATYAEYVRCVKRIASTTFSIMNDATRRKKPAPFAAHFRQTMAEPFMAVWRQWLSFCIQQEDRTMHKKSELFAIRFLKLCTLDERLFTTALRPHALAIIEGLFFPYLCHNAEDEEVFADADNLSDFVQYMMEEGVGNGELTQRQAASNAILSMLGGKKQFHDTAGLLQELLGVLTSGLSQPDTPENLPRLFGFLHLLSILRKYLRQVPDIWTTQMAQVLMRFVAPRLQPNVASIALRCKAIVVAQRYSKVPMPTEEDFASFMQMCCSLVGDADARVRLSAIDMMCSLLEMKHARPYLQPILVPLVQECMAFLNTVHTTYVPTVILHLATHFAPELTPVMGSLGSSLTQHFLATTFDLQQQEDGGDVEANMSAYERAAFSADALLDAIFTVVTSCGEAPEALAAMRPDVLRMVERVLREPDCFDFLDKSLGILLHVVTFTKPISADLWAMLPLVFGSVESGIGVDFFSTVEEVLDNFVSGATVEYLSNDEVMEATYAVCEKMLVGGVVCTTECQLAPAQLIEAMLHQSIKHPGIFDRHLPRFLHLLLRALVHPDIAVGDVRIRLWCLAAVMDAFFYDAATTMELIVQAGAYPNLFDAMFQFFGGCFTDFPEIAAVYATSSSAAPKSGKKKSAKTRNEAAEVVEQLSILTRKVIALGLSSLVRVMASVASGATTSSASMVGAAANFMAHHAAPSVALIQYCIFTNEELLQARNQLAVVNLDKIRRGEEEEVEDVDLNDDEVLGVDGGDDLNEVYDDVSEADLDDENVGLAMDEGDEYDSPIDDVNEVTPLLQWLREVGQQCAAIASCVRPAADFERAEKTAADYRRLCVELEQAMAADFDQRRAAAS